MEPRHERGGGPKRCSFIEFSDSGASRRNLAFFLANVWSLGINWMGFFPFFSSLLFVNARSEVLEYFGKVMTSGWRFIKSNENFSSEKRQENFQYFRSMIMYVYIYIYWAKFVLFTYESLHSWREFHFVVIYDQLIDPFSSRSKIQLNDSLQSDIYLLLRGRFHAWWKCVVETKTYFTQRWNFSKLRYV